MVGREGKGGHSFLAIDHIRDQLIPPQVFFYSTICSTFKVHFIFRREAIKLRSGTKQLPTSELTRAGCEEFGQDISTLEDVPHFKKHIVSMACRIILSYNSRCYI